MNRSQTLGREGEDLITNLLLQRGWMLNARNWRRRGAELDIVVAEGDRILFVEVKTRLVTGPFCSDPRQILSWRKKELFIRGVQIYLREMVHSDYRIILTYLALVSRFGAATDIVWYPLEGLPV